MINFIYGIVAGIVTGLGMGGGTILILFLTVFGHIEQKISQGVNLVFFIPTSIVAIIGYIKNKQLNVKQSLPIVGGGIAGAIIGAKITSGLNNEVLKKIFGGFILVIACFEIYKFYMNNIKKVTETKRKTKE